MEIPKIDLSIKPTKTDKKLLDTANKQIVLLFKQSINNVLKKIENLKEHNMNQKSYWTWNVWKSFERPSNFFKLSSQEQFIIDKSLGILDWQGDDSSPEDINALNNIINKIIVKTLN